MHWLLRGIYHWQKSAVLNLDAAPFMIEDYRNLQEGCAVYHGFMIT